MFLTTLAQVNFGGKYNPPLYDGNAQLGIKGVSTLVSTILSNVYILAGVLLLVLILIGGFKMIQSAGTKDAQKAAEAKNTLTYAILGFLIIFVSYWIIQIIEKLFGLSIL